MLHRIDKYILKELLTHDTLPFSELRPPGVETNTLTYRLSRLRQEGIINKTKTGQYVLTASGRRYTDSLNLGKFVPRDFPRPITLIVCRKDDQWLLIERLIHPLKNLVGLPHANLKPGVSIVDSAEQRLREVVGIEVKLAMKGFGYLTFYNGNGELEGYNQVNIVENTSWPKGELKADSELDLGRYFWQSAPNFAKSNYIPSMHDIEELLDDNPKQLFFFEKTYKLKGLN